MSRADCRRRVRAPRPPRTNRGRTDLAARSAASCLRAATNLIQSGTADIHTRHSHTPRHTQWLVHAPILGALLSDEWKKPAGDSTDECTLMDERTELIDRPSLVAGPMLPLPVLPNDRFPYAYDMAFTGSEDKHVCTRNRVMRPSKTDAERCVH